MKLKNLLLILSICSAAMIISSCEDDSDNILPKPEKSSQLKMMTGGNKTESVREI